MFFKTLIASLLLMAIVMLALGIKLLFDPKAEFTIHPCSMKDDCLDSEDTCPSCGTKEITDFIEEKPS